MVSTVTSVIEQNFRDFARSLDTIMREASDIYSAYFATDATTKVSGLASGTDGASWDTKYTKTVYTNSITFIENITKFFNNQAVSTGDYLSTMDAALYANAASPNLLSPATEALANRIYVLFQTMVSQFIVAKDILDFYNNSELSVLVAGATGSRVVYGATMNVTQLSQGITLVEQFKKMINNEAVSTGLYSTNVAVWRMI